MQNLGTFFGNALANSQDCRRANVVEPLRRATRLAELNQERDLVRSSGAGV